MLREDIQTTETTTLYIYIIYIYRCMYDVYICMSNMEEVGIIIIFIHFWFENSILFYFQLPWFMWLLCEEILVSVVRYVYVPLFYPPFLLPFPFPIHLPPSLYLFLISSPSFLSPLTPHPPPNCTSSSSVVVLAHVLVALTQRAHGSAQLPFLKDFYHHSKYATIH